MVERSDHLNKSELMKWNQKPKEDTTKTTQPKKVKHQ